ncbi:GerMN domain-containing protein [Thermus caliditerrae]|uniref:GerMN domain-containing protein n=1 Tax=Thermus caliditerrae TaxID=1330700 RepID=UPI00056FF92C|nr:GerMN domain-containing protein [Thermus caliditerrae]
MRRVLTPWNLLGAFLFLLGALVFWQSGSRPGAGALPLPSAEPAAPNQLALSLYRPDPPRGFVKEALTLTLGPGETPEGKALEAWSQALNAPPPQSLYRQGKRLVVDLPATFVQGLDATGEAYRLYSLAYTLLSALPEVEEVHFLVEGRPSPGLAHLDLQKPIRLP